MPHILTCDAYEFNKLAEHDITLSMTPTNTSEDTGSPWSRLWEERDGHVRGTTYADAGLKPEASQEVQGKPDTAGSP